MRPVRPQIARPECSSIREAARTEMHALSGENAETALQPKIAETARMELIQEIDQSVCDQIVFAHHWWCLSAVKSAVSRASFETLSLTIDTRQHPPRLVAEF